MVLQAFEEIKEALPFGLKGIDSDNDSGFINYHLKAFCDREKIRFTPLDSKHLTGFTYSYSYILK